MNKMNMSPSPQNGAKPRGEVEADNDPQPGSVDKIRDILFGAQMLDYEKKFSRLEARLLQESTGLREDIQRRFDSLETALKREVESIAKTQKHETAERTDAVKNLTAGLQHSNEGWKKKASEHEEQSAHLERELRQSLLEASKGLTELIEQRHAASGREAQELRAMLTDRFALADMFAELAGRLKNADKPTRAA